jgi:hypothetical protein
VAPAAAAQPAVLPAYSGPAGACPKCGQPDALTAWHWAGGGLAPQELGGRAPACGELGDLVGPGVQGEHLCRLCGTCGYGWAEACVIASSAELGRVLLLSPAAGALLVSLTSGLASAGAAILLSAWLGGAALIAAWVAVTAAISVTVVAGYTAAAARAGKERAR